MDNLFSFFVKKYQNLNFLIKHDKVISKKIKEGGRSLYVAIVCNNNSFTMGYFRNNI